MRISDWSSDVCSSDLLRVVPVAPVTIRPGTGLGNPGACGQRQVARQWVADFHVGGSEQAPGLVAAGAHGRDADAQGVPVGEVEVRFGPVGDPAVAFGRSEEHTSELQSLMRISYAVFCLKKKKKIQKCIYKMRPCT